MTKKEYSALIEKLKEKAFCAGFARALLRSFPEEYICKVRFEKHSGYYNGMTELVRSMGVKLGSDEEQIDDWYIKGSHMAADLLMRYSKEYVLENYAKNYYI